MNITKLIIELQNIREVYGDLEVHLQNTPKDGELIVSEQVNFAVPEEYDDGVFCNLRSWPY